MTGEMASVRFKYLVRDTDRHGTQRIYVRVPGRSKVRLHAPEGSDLFLEQYRAAFHGEPLPGVEPKPRPAPRLDLPGTIGELIADYRASSDFRDLAPSTKRVRARLLSRLEVKTGAVQATKLRAADVMRWRDAPDGPEAGNAVVKTLRQVLGRAVKAEKLEKNVAALVDYRRPTSPDGFTAWDLDDVKAFVKKHPRGTMAYLALCLFLFTVQRRSDVHTFGRQHERNGGTELRFTQAKNRSRRPVVMDIPIIAPLRDAIDACPESGQLTYIVSEHGRPYGSAASFGNRMGKWCREAGLAKGKNGHGIRKAQGDLLAGLGLTAHQIMAIMGHSSTKQGEVYTRRADRRRLAHEGLKRLENALNHEQIVPLGKPVRKVGQNGPATN
jgi:integrase